MVILFTYICYYDTVTNLITTISENTEPVVQKNNTGLASDQAQVYKDTSWPTKPFIGDSRRTWVPLGTQEAQM